MTATTTKLDIWLDKRSHSVRLPVHIADAFKAMAKADGWTISENAQIARRAHNGTLAEAIAAYVLKHSADVCLYTTRESWIGKAVELMRPEFEARGYPLPANIRATIAFTSKGWKGKWRGECWLPNASADGAVEIMVDLCESDTAEIVSILTRELAHAAQGVVARERAAKLKDGTKAQASVLKAARGHGKVWKEVAAAVDLEPLEKADKNGKVKEDWTRAYGGDAWKTWAQPIIDALGKCPHAALAKAVKKEAEEGKQTTRMLKFTHEACPATEDGGDYVWRASAKSVADKPKVFCPCCGQRVVNPHCGGWGEADTAEDEDSGDALAEVGKAVRKAAAQRQAASDGRSTVRKPLDDAAQAGGREAVENRLRGNRNRYGDRVPPR